MRVGWLVGSLGGEFVVHSLQTYVHLVSPFILDTQFALPGISSNRNRLILFIDTNCYITLHYGCTEAMQCKEHLFLCANERLTNSSAWLQKQRNNRKWVEAREINRPWKYILLLLQTQWCSSILSHPPLCENTHSTNTVGYVFNKHNNNFLGSFVHHIGEVDNVSRT